MTHGPEAALASLSRLRAQAEPASLGQNTTSAQDIDSARLVEVVSGRGGQKSSFGRAAAKGEFPAATIGAGRPRLAAPPGAGTR